MFNFFKKKEFVVDQDRIESATKYIKWLEDETKEFFDKLKEKNFNPDWGFEVYKTIDTWNGETGVIDGEYCIFDIQPMEIIAVDNSSKCLLYAKFGKGNFSGYVGKKMKYEYKIIPFSDIFNVCMKVDSQTRIHAQTSNKDIIKRGIVGGLIAGDVGAIIGATSAKTKMNTESIPEKLEFCIQTVDTELPYIEFKFNTYSTWISKNGSRDTMYGLFSNEDGKFNYHFSEQKRDGGSKCDCYFDRSFHIYEYDGNDPEEYEPVMDDIEYSNHLETLIHRFTKYSRKIETIINGNKF